MNLTKQQMRRNNESLDTFYHGRISILQKIKGYRFSLAAPVLADFIQTKKSDELLELGAGNCVISLLLSIKPFKHITALEIQESLYSLAQRSIRLNQLQHKISILCLDLREYKTNKKFDVIFSNPPYFDLAEGRMSISREKAIAKHEVKCSIYDLMSKTSELLKKEGRAYFIFQEKRKEAFMQALKKNGLSIALERCLKSRPQGKTSLFLTKCVFSPEKKVVLPPLILYDEEENYTEEAQEIFKGRIHAATYKKV